MSNYEVKNVEPVAVSNDVQVRVFTLAHGDVIPWHYHRESTDHYFVLRGTLTIETRGPDNRCVLPVGERYKILPGTAHRISNESASECQFLLVQGVGKYDWHRADWIAWALLQDFGEAAHALPGGYSLARHNAWGLDRWGGANFSVYSAARRSRRPA
jgi:quercetin dioxygenase-like cupin family protein